jgi:type II secretory pathway component PulF
MLLVILLIFTLFIFMYNKSLSFKAFVHQCIMRIPIVSGIVRAHKLSEIFDMISTLVSGGCPFIEAVIESSAFMGLIPYKTALSFAAREMQVGSNFSKAVGHYPRLFPGLAVDSLAIGERTGNTETILQQMSRYYARELQSALTSLSKLIEPALMIAVGIIVGAAALSIVLPIYDISQHLSG